MRRLVAIAALLYLAALLPLEAQHGGGHASGGGHSSFSGHSGFSGGGSAGHAFSGSSSGAHAGSNFAPRSFSSSRSFSQQSLNRQSYNRQSFTRQPLNRTGSALGVNSRNFHHAGVNHSTHVHVHTYGLRNNCYGYRCGYGYGYPWLNYGFDPYWWWNSGSSYDQDQQEQIGLANEMNAQSLDEQRMREQADQEFYPRSPAAEQQPERTEAAPATVLVFRDQHKEEIQNYAIVGQTLWNFSAQRTKKIPISDLDVPATTKANDERGVTFRLPGGNEGQ
jgi:hypothetical protein